MAKTSLGSRVLSVLLAASMVASLNAPVSAWAAGDDATGGAAAVEQSLDPAGGGESENADAGTAGSDTSQAVENQSATDASDEEGSTEGAGEAEAGTVKIGDTAYSTLAEAIKAANDGDTITLGAGEFTTYGNASPKKSLTFVGAGEDTVWTIGDLTKDVNGEANGDYSFDGCDTITFKSMTLKSDNKNYRGFIRINNTVVENCTLVGKTAYWGYNTATFKGSTFNAPEGDYALWDYSTKEMSFDGCTFNISGKGVNVYVEADNAGEATRTVAVNNCTVNSTKANKAFLNIKNSTYAYDVTLSGTNTVNGLEANSTTGSALYQVETTEVTETSGKTVSVKEKAADGTVTTVYEVKQASSNVAKVGDTEYATLQAAIDAAPRNATVKLLADTYENVTISTNAITLDLNGHTLNGGTVKAKPALTINNTSVTVQDSSEAQTGTIMREDTAENSGVSSHYVIDVQGGNGFLLFNSGTVKNNSGTANGAKGASLVRVGNDSDKKAHPVVTIAGGTFTQDNFIAIKVDFGTLYVKGGVINSKNSYAVENWLNANIKDNAVINGNVSSWTYAEGSNSNLNISGGTVNGNVESVTYDGAEGKTAKVSITGGMVSGTLSASKYNSTEINDPKKATIEVTGGTFSTDPSRYLVEGSTVNKNDDGTFGVAKAYLAKVGETSYYTMDDAFKAQTTSGEAITLLRDYTTGSTFNSGTVARVVDLNGHTWTCTGTDANSAAFEINYANASLTVKNGKIVSSQLIGLIPSASGGTITYDNSTLTFDGVEASTTATSGIETNGNNTNDTVVLKDSTLSVPNGFGIYFPSSGTLTIDNSVINAKTMGVQVCAGSLNISGDKTAITVTDDGVKKTENDGAIQDGAAISIVNRSGYKGLETVKVTGGTFKANGTNAAVKAYDWANQTESGFTQGDKVAISGGTFSAAVASDLCAEGYAPVANADGTYSVGVPVAQIGGTVFTSLQAAIDAAQAGDTVQLLADVVVDDTVIVKDKGAITLDLNDKTISNTKEIWDEAAYKWSLISVRGNSDLTITGHGALNALANDVYAIDLYDAASKCTIENGTFTGNISAVYIFEGMLTINGGSFDIQQLSSQGDHRFTINCYDSNYKSGAAQVSINGGTFKGFDPANNLAEGTGTTFTAPGYTSVANADGTYGVVAGVAQIGTKAYASLQAAIDAAQDGETVTLLTDASEDVAINKNITLDLGGKTLTNTNAGKATISVQGGTVTVKNGNVVGGTGYYNIEVTKGSNANLTLTDVTATAGNTGSSMIDNWGTMTITSGTYTGGVNVVKSEEGSTLTITGGTFTLDYATDGYTAVILVYGDTTISGGEFIQSLTTTGRWDHPQVVATGVVEGYTAITRVTGGHFVNKKSSEGIFRGIGKGTSDNFAVSGGTFNKSISEDYCADGFIPTKNADGTYGVKEGSYVAEIGSKKYETLADAIRLAAKGKTITLLADVEQNSQLTINKSITLDLNGKTIRNTVDIWGDNANAILSITNGAKVTITGNGTIDAKENDCYTINVVKGDLTIENGTFYGNVSVVQVQEGNLYVKGGTFDLHQKWEGGSKYLINCIDDAYTSGEATVTISGGTFVGFDPNVSPEKKVDGKAPSFAAPGAGITKNEDGSFTAAAGMTAQILDKDGNSVKAYESLTDAIAAAEDGQTVKLLANVTESSITVNANITIDLNKMTVTGSFATRGEVTIQNGTIDVPDGKTNYAYGKLTLADVNITGKAVSSSLLSVNYNGSVTIDKDSTIVADSAKGNYPAVFIKGQDDSGKTYAPELNIYGTVQSAKTPAIQGNGTDRGVSHVNVLDGAVVKSESLAVYLPQPCEVNITGGLVEGYCGIGIKSGTLNISGGTVRGVANDNVIGDQYSQTNGISYDGSAIMIDSYIGYAGQVQINISGTATVESKYSTAIREIGNDKSQTNLVGLTITGGKVLGAEGTDAVLVRDVTAKDVNISGGEFSSIVKKDYCAPGFTPVTEANNEGLYEVAEGHFTVKVTSRTTTSDSPVANVSGGGSNVTYAEGTTVTASAISGYNFVGWFVNGYSGEAYSTNLTCEVKPTDNCTMIAVYEPVSGGVFALEISASKFKVNNGATQRSYLLEKVAIGTSVTVEFTGSENFLYWVNESGKVLSTSKAYTFPMGSATTLKAVYAEKEENQAMVVFISHTQQIVSSKGYTTSDTIQFPEPPIKMGATFVRWSMTQDEIREAMATTTTGIIVVEPVYESTKDEYTVTINYPGGETKPVTAKVGEIADLEAKTIEGLTFKCWKNGNTVLGYTETLKVAPRGDLNLTAEYVAEGTAVERLPVITLTEIDASQQGQKYAVSFTATRSVPEGYAVTEQGVLVSIDSRYGEADALDAMKLDADGAKPAGTLIFKDSNTDATGVTVLNGTTKYADRTVYGRAYMILRDNNGTMMYVYSDTILSGSYNSLTNGGGN